MDFGSSRRDPWPKSGHNPCEHGSVPMALAGFMVISIEPWWSTLSGVRTLALHLARNWKLGAKKKNERRHMIDQAEGGWCKLVMVKGYVHKVLTSLKLRDVYQVCLVTSYKERVKMSCSYSCDNKVKLTRKNLRALSHSGQVQVCSISDLEIELWHIKKAGS